MVKVTAALVKELREKTGAGMMDCKRALAETDGDIEGAVDYAFDFNLTRNLFRKVLRKADAGDL